MRHFQANSFAFIAAIAAIVEPVAVAFAIRNSDISTDRTAIAVTNSLADRTALAAAVRNSNISAPNSSTNCYSVGKPDVHTSARSATVCTCYGCIQLS